MGAPNLSPMDAFRYFQRPTFASVALTQNVATKLVSADPMRVGIIISSPTASGLVVGLDRSTAINKGINVVGSTLPLMLTQQDWGALVQGEFWAFTAQAGQFATVIENRLAPWPDYAEGGTSVKPSAPA